ncbi:hypothetical protein KBB96_04690 [Luteolibacter ambystomatis]|uniref:DUF4198 domain-containing protein n=1 Tax=Luteolibacter ambystomatis TaxID=2824561 RepID=A0A975J1A8_9BACT|nr:hypothetical protein [Luteolibacter ambystomatis]QUE52190.1 hypothetical protein KBB96_04690 [Luteolibacter ambystomatis]
MKHILILTGLMAGLFAAPLHAHGSAGKAGPNGGRVLKNVEPHAEFLVTPDKKVRITFLDAEGKATVQEGAQITVTSGDRSSPTKLTFTKDGNSYISDKPLPEGKNVPVVIQIKATADGKSVTEKFGANLAECSECKHPEYACTCDHAE